MKKEYMTCIRKGEYAQKDCQAIRFRGALDTLDAQFAWGVALAREHGDLEAAQALTELRLVGQKVMAADVTLEPLAVHTYLGLPEKEVHRFSHNPSLIGAEHMVGKTELSTVLAAVNLIRTAVRDVEREAVCLFVHGEAVEREDILTVLNRLSSATYVLMCRIRAKENKVGEDI